jgi:hypothetical protein
MRRYCPLGEWYSGASPAAARSASSRASSWGSGVLLARNVIDSSPGCLPGSATVFGVRYAARHRVSRVRFMEEGGTAWRLH